MARKDLLKSLMEAAMAEAPARPAPQYAKGAIGAVSRSIEDLKTRALVDIPADLIDDAGIADRLDSDGDGIAALKASIRDYGQQVPVLVRQSRAAEGRYQIVYGRRRVQALKDLGLPVKAMIRDLSDQELVIAQGQENSARKDLTFIEKANFARQMRDAGYERRIICDALHIDKTVISRMLVVADAVPLRVIQAIGAAPSAGRDRWLLLAERIKGHEMGALYLAKGATSDERFQAVLTTLNLERPRRPTPLRVALNGADGAPLGQVTQGRGTTVLTLAESAGFSRWIVENIEEIHRGYLNSRVE